MNHQSGIKNYTNLETYQPSVKEKPGQPWNECQIDDLINKTELDFQACKGWNYSNTGYYLLRKLLEKLTGSSFSNAITELILSPIGLINTMVADRIMGDQLTPAYSRELSADGSMENVSNKYNPLWCFTGNIASTTENIVQFFDRVFVYDFLLNEQLLEMCEPISVGQPVPNFGDPCYGLGLMIDTKSKYGRLYSHSGEGPGFNSWVMHLPDFFDRPLTMAVFSNTGLPGIIPLAYDLLSIMEQ